MEDLVSNVISGTLISSIWGFCSFISWGLLTTFYSMTLMKAMKSLPADKRPMSPGLAFLGFVPGLGIIWHAVFAIIVAAKLRSHTKSLGLKPNSALAFAIAHPSFAFLCTIVSMVLFFNIILNMILGFFGFESFVHGDFSGLSKGFLDFYLFTTFIDLGLHLVELPLFLIHWVSLAKATSILNKQPQVNSNPQIQEAVE